MLCPRCQSPLTPVGKFAFCGNSQHSQALEPATTAAPPVSARLVDLARLPSILALPLHEFAGTTQPVLRLHRLCDAVEVLTRFCTLVLLGELRGLQGNRPLPDDLLDALRPRIQLPTFGKWKDMLEALAGRLADTAPLVVPEMLTFVNQELLPALPGGDGQLSERCLITLRNLLVHGGAMTRSRALHFLQGEPGDTPERFIGWEARLTQLIGRLDFLADCTVCFHAEDGTRRLSGTLAAGEPLEVPADLRLALGPLARHVVLLRQRRWLDLWPLCDFGRARVPSLRGPVQAEHDSPLVYIRAEPQRLLYAALGSELSHAERSDRMEEFRTLFCLDQRQPGLIDTTDFEEELRRDSDELLGRVAELRQLKDVLKATPSGVLWLAGAGGLGKSFLMARLAHDLSGDPRKGCRIFWRFKVGDGAHCSRPAFLRHAVERLIAWPPLTGLNLTPSADPVELAAQLERLLTAAGQLTAEDPRSRPPRVLLCLDGLDEIDRLDPHFAQLPFRLSRPNVVWVCAGRPERTLPAVFTPQRCTHVFADGLPPMSSADMRGLLLDGTGCLKYELLRRDDEASGGRESPEFVVSNAAVEAVVRKAEGLPLYVRFVVEDVLAGHFHFRDLESQLPPRLSAYYDDLLQRLALGDLQALLTPLVVTIAWAKAPLGEETLLWLLARRTVLEDSAEGRALLTRGLEAVRSMVRLAPAENGRTGYEPYHTSFRDHVRKADQLKQQSRLAQQGFCALARDWSSLPEDHPALRYALRYGVRELLEYGRVAEAATLLRDWRFLEAKTEAGYLFELAGDFTELGQALTEGEGRRWFGLVEEAIRRDIHFLARHPSCLFQRLWNLCWWYDSPETARHYDLSKRTASGPLPWEREGERLAAWMERWREAKERPGFVWVRSLRPPPVHLGTAQKMVLRGHTHIVSSVSVSADGRRIVSGSEDNTVRVWDATSGAELHCLKGHTDRVDSVSVSADGRRIVSGSGSEDNTVRVWDAASGAELLCLSGHTLGVSLTADGRRIVSGSWFDRTVRVWDATSGAELLCLPRNGC